MVLLKRPIEGYSQNKKLWLLSNLVDENGTLEKERKWLTSSFCYGYYLSKPRKSYRYTLALIFWP